MGEGRILNTTHLTLSLCSFIIIIFLFIQYYDIFFSLPQLNCFDREEPKNKNNKDLQCYRKWRIIMLRIKMVWYWNPRSFIFLSFIPYIEYVIIREYHNKWLYTHSSFSLLFLPLFLSLFLFSLYVLFLCFLFIVSSCFSLCSSTAYCLLVVRKMVCRHI